jgi:hypothetical protein
MNKSKRIIEILRGESGASLAFIAVILVALLAVSALAIDLGMLYIGQQRAQNVCDESALSAVVLLTGQPNCATQTGLPATTAQQVATTNNQLSPKWQVYVPGTSTPGVQVTFPTGTVTSNSGQAISVTSGQAITVKGFVNVTYGFAQIMGLQSRTVSASATAIVEPMNSLTSSLFVPLVVSNTTVFGGNGQPALQFGQEATLKTTAWQDNFLGPGNFGMIDLPGDGPGGSTLRSRLAGDLPAVTVSGVPSTTVSTEPGNKTGPVYQGLSDRLAKETNPLFTNDSTAWANWLAAYNSTTGTFPSTWRLALVPIVQDPSAPVNGRSTVTIIGYAGFFIESAPKNQPVVGRFIQGTYVGGNIRWIFPTGNNITSPIGIQTSALVS